MKVVIVGAGMSGLCLGIKLEQAGIPYVILEKSERLGGTWWDNTYPGCACDIPSHLYAYSFAPADWTRVYPGQPEILAYLERCADEYGVRPRIRFGVRVDEARWDETARRWVLRTSEGEVTGDVFVSAVGALHEPKYPDLPGRERFAGTSFHSARWDASCDLTNKRVAVIGNAASAVQLVPEIARQAAEVTVFQRTAHWVLPKPDGPYSAGTRRFFRLFPALLRLYRWLLYLRQEVGFLMVFRRKSLIASAMRAWALRRMRRQVRDPAAREALVPGYALGCKRILLSNDYYAALDRDDVHLVTDPLLRIEPEGLVTEAGRHEVDVLIYATGFDPQAWGHLEVIGRDGQRLGERWGRDPRAHLGMTVPGFPNYFLLLGPNTGLGHNSVMWMVECQVTYVMRCLAAMRRRGWSTLEVTPEALEDYYAEITRLLGTSVWTGCRSWYQNEAGLIYALWPSSTLRYWWRTRRPDLKRELAGEP